MKKIMITGATGKYGEVVIEKLIEKGINSKLIYALVRDHANAENLKTLGVNIIVGDYNDYKSLTFGFAGIDKLLLVSSSEIKNRINQHKKVIKAAKTAGVNHILYTSQLHKTDKRTSPIYFIMKSHLATEIEIMKSGINYTIFRNGIYLEILPLFLGKKVLEKGIILPSGQGKLAFSMRSEMAEATVNILLSEGHKNKIIDISGSGVSFTEVASMISQITEKNITYLSPSYDTFISNAINTGMPKEQAKILGSFALAAQQGELDGDNSQFDRFLGRKSTSVFDFLLENFG